MRESCANPRSHGYLYIQGWHSFSQSIADILSKPGCASCSVYLGLGWRSKLELKFESVPHREPIHVPSHRDVLGIEH